MMKTFDDLIYYLLEEIALCGEQGMVEILGISGVPCVLYPLMWLRSSNIRHRLSYSIILRNLIRPESQQRARYKS